MRNATLEHAALNLTGHKTLWMLFAPECSVHGEYKNVLVFPNSPSTVPAFQFLLFPLLLFFFLDICDSADEIWESSDHLWRLEPLKNVAIHCRK